METHSQAQVTECFDNTSVAVLSWFFRKKNPENPHGNP